MYHTSVNVYNTAINAVTTEVRTTCTGLVALCITTKSRPAKLTTYMDAEHAYNTDHLMLLAFPGLFLDTLTVVLLLLYIRVHGECYQVIILPSSGVLDSHEKHACVSAHMGRSQTSMQLRAPIATRIVQGTAGAPHLYTGVTCSCRCKACLVRFRRSNADKHCSPMSVRMP